jgi:hypothetical protein
MTARTKRSAAVKAAIYCSMLSETVKIFDLVFVSWGYFNMKLHCKNKKSRAAKTLPLPLDFAFRFASCPLIQAHTYIQRESEEQSLLL